MRHTRKRDRWLGLFFLLFAVVLVCVWVPLDTETGLVEKVRRRLTIGDALGPTVAGVLIALGAVLTLAKPQPDDAGAQAHRSAVWVGSLLGVFVLSMVLMRFAGPLAGLLTESGYRPLRNTLPWKYIGFLLGGTALVAGMVALVERRLSVRAVLLGVAASLIMALAYDLPFEDVLLPPNGDV